MTTHPTTNTIAITGSTGKVGSRVAERIGHLGADLRRAFRAGDPPFDWDDPASWLALLDGASSVFVSFFPDLGFPGAADTIGAFAEVARTRGVERLVLLSGRGEPEAARSEEAMRAAGVPSTVLRCSWFAQNFSEHFLLQSVLDGVIALPVDDVPEPFVDLDDVADVAVRALLEPGHADATYELTGPDALTFREAARILSQATGRRIEHIAVSPEDYVTAAVAVGVPVEEAEALTSLFATVLDGRNSYTTDDIARVLGRPPTAFAEYARRAAATGVWTRVEQR
ncbi:MAG: NmrA family NAD(P)-binding protein [Ilumatobacteraceae bacterium]